MPPTTLNSEEPYKDHPHSRGENHWRRSTDFALNGSLYSLRNFSFKASKMSSEKALMS